MGVEGSQITEVLTTALTTVAPEPPPASFRPPQAERLALPTETLSDREQAEAIVQAACDDPRTQAFAAFWYTCHTLTWNGARYLGLPIQKCPMDLWVQQEIIADLKPALIIETGTFYGASALYFAHVCDAVGTGRVLTIDLNPLPRRIAHPRVKFVVGNSVSDEVIQIVQDAAAQAAGPVLVILDSDHARGHVARELALYAPLVTLRSYCIVEDTNVSGKPVWNPDFAADGGPYPAVEAFLETPLGQSFRADKLCEHFLLSLHPDGWLKRVA